ncbi:MAG: hypothetical protein ABSA72_08555 [Nitrososphaerales archaeon]|jgi:hypothetical protein
MKTAKIAAIGAASVFAMVALLLAYPAMAATQPNTSLITTSATSTTPTSVIPPTLALSPGQTITFSSTSGVWKVISDPSAHVKTGTASGTATLTVKASYKGGYALSLTSGSISINGTTYAFGTGSAVMGPHQAHLVGQGSLVGAASATPGSFIFAAGAHASFEGQTYNTLRFDVQVNGQEYGVVLLVTASVSPTPVAA